MSQGPEGRDPIEELAEQFMERLRRGESPAVSEYEARHPDLADEIRDLFPALLMMERAKPGSTASRHHAAEPAGPPGQLGDYRILREVARGGMGVVYEAEQTTLGRHVALKLLPAEAAGDPVRLLRFRREARSAARLHHTNIVPVFDVGSADGVHYYAMQFIRGQGLDEVLDELRRLRAGGGPTVPQAEALTASLAEGLRTGVFPGMAFMPGAGARARRAVPRPEPSATLVGPVSHYFRSVTGLGIQAAEALAYAHGKRVLHRDVKPSNLLLDHQGTLWLTDFGLAKDDGDDLTRTGDIVGTLRYMAPERFRGMSDPRTDVYALGVTLYELLTLRPAFDDSDRMLLVRRIAQEDPPRPRAIDPTIPRDLETIVLKAIEKDPARRYPTAADLGEDLKRFLADRPIKARRASWRELGWRWCRRNPGVAGSLAAAFVFLLLLVAGLSAGGLLVVQAKRVAEAAKAEVERSLAEERRALYFQRIALADRQFAENDMNRGEELLALCREELRGWEWHYLNRNRGRMSRPFALPGAVTRFGGLSPDGRWGALPGTGGVVYVIDFPAGSVATLRAHAADASECVAAFTPDGRFLVTADEPARGNATVRLWDPATLLPVGEGWEYPHGGIFPFAISPDGRRLLTSSLIRGIKEYRIDIWDLATGVHLTEVEGRHAEPVQSLAFSPDGRRVASASPDGTVRLSDGHTGRTLHVFRHDRRVGYKFWCVAFRQDGRRVAAGFGDERQRSGGGVLLWDAATGEACGTLTGHDVFGLAFGPGGRLFTAGSDGTIRVWDPDRGQELLSFRGHTDVSHCLGFTPDGRRLVTAGMDRLVRVWDATPVRSGEHLGDERQTLRAHANGVHTARYLPDGRGVVTASSDGTVRRLPLDPRDGSAALLASGADVDVVVNRDMLAIVEDGGEESRLLSLATGRTLRPLERPSDDERVSSLRFSPGGDLLAGCSLGGNAIFVWDVATGRLRSLEGHNYYPYGAAFRPGGARCLLTTVSTAGEVFVWDPQTGERRAEHQHPAATAVAFRPDGRRMATAGWDRVVRLWDTTADDPRDWTVIESYPDTTGGPNAVAFSPDGTLLAWGGTDSVIKVWSLRTREVATLRGHRNWVWDVEFRPDGGEIVSASRDGTVKLWPNPFAGRGTLESEGRP